MEFIIVLRVATLTVYSSEYYLQLLIQLEKNGRNVKLILRKHLVYGTIA